MSDACTIDGFGPLPVIRPASVTDVAELVRQARADGSALYPTGGRTKLGMGNVPAKAGCCVDMRGVADVIDFPARDMTITVEAGITIQSLREIAEKEKLHLPIDVAQSERATLGGVLATNVSGPRRFCYGTLRDYVIGISALNDEGHAFKAGGRVVKNVAGYDLCKLLVGSFGTLGIITQVTLKLRPIAEEQALIALACSTSDLECIANCLHDTNTRPTCLELMNPPAARATFERAALAAPDAPWVALVGYEGNAAAVEWQVQQLVKEVGAKCRVQGRLDDTARPLCHALVEYGSMPEHGTVFKASLLPSATLAFCVEVDQDSSRPALQAHLGNGIVHGHWASDLTKDEASRILNTWREHARKAHGSVVVLRCPSEWKALLDVWGAPRGDAWLMREIKRKFDPKHIFNPGRFVDGI